MSSSRVVSASPHFQQQGQRRRTAHSSSGAGTGDGTGIDGDGGGGDDNLYLCDEDFPLVTSRENKAAHSIAMAEAEVLKARSASVDTSVDFWLACQCAGGGEGGQAEWFCPMI